MILLMKVKRHCEKMQKIAKILVFLTMAIFESKQENKIIQILRCHRKNLKKNRETKRRGNDFEVSFHVLKVRVQIIRQYHRIHHGLFCRKLLVNLDINIIYFLIIN